MIWTPGNTQDVEEIKKVRLGEENSEQYVCMLVGVFKY